MSYRKQALRFLRVAVVVPAIVFTLALAPVDSGLAFVDGDPLDLTLAQAKKGTNVAACNLGEDELTGLDANLIGFGSPVRQAVQQPADFDKALGIGKCTQIPVRVSDRLNPEAGTYKGLLSAVASAVEATISDIGRYLADRADQ